MNRESLHILTVVGARPQFIKGAALSRAVRQWNTNAGARQFRETMVHTGQHYDYELSQAFFEELEIPEPVVNLGVGSGPHGAQTGEMLAGLERVIQERRPDWVVAYGDTNSTAAAILAAAKLKIPTAHVEAGLREHDRRIPEEVNKIVADHLSDVCFAPTETAMQILEREGLGDRAVLVGDIMLDTTVWVLERLSERFVDEVLARFRVEAGEFVLATTHRAATREDPEALRSVFEALRDVPMPVVLPLHPSTRAAAEGFGLDSLLCSDDGLNVTAPVRYAEMLALLRNCRMVVTDSGGLIKEAYFFRKPCITIDWQTEWVETLEGGWNRIAGPDRRNILEAVSAPEPDRTAHRSGIFGEGRTAPKILEVLDLRS